MAKLSGEAVDQVAEKTGVPAYKVRAVMREAWRLVLAECKRGRPVVLPGLGSFAAKTMPAKSMMIREGTAPVLKSFPARRKLTFVPKRSTKWL